MPAGITGSNALAGASLSVIAFFAFRWWFWPRPLQGIPHDKVTSIWGDIAEMRKLKEKQHPVSTHFFYPRADRLGPLYQAIFGPFGSLLVLSDAQETEDLLLRHTKSLETSSLTRELMAGVIRFSQISLKSGEQWKKHRRLIGPSMLPNYLRFMTPRITSNIDLLIRLWMDKMRIVEQKNGTCFPFELDLRFCTMDAMGEICFGESFNGLHDAQASLYDQPPTVGENGEVTFPHIKGSPLYAAVEYLMKLISDGRSFPAQLKWCYYVIAKLTKRWKVHYGGLSRFIERRIADARGRAEAMKAHGVMQETADCIVDMIMEREGKEDPESMTDVEIKDELMGLVFAGQDTTASVLCFGIKYLGNNPEVQVKLRQELMERLESPLGRPLTYDEISSTEDLPYLEAVVAETLRLGSAVMGFSRQLTENSTILGCPVPKGTNILFLSSYAGTKTTTGAAEIRIRQIDPARSKSSIAHGLSKGLWDEDNATTFKPERWLVEHEDPVSGNKRLRFSAKQGVSMPFGLGTRACFGIKLATLELKLFMASLNLAFFFDAVPEELNSFEVKEAMIRCPKQTFVALRDWQDIS